MSRENGPEKVFVYADWEGIESPFLMGILYAEKLRGKEVFSFSYEAAWLESGQAQVLDPDLQLYSGVQYLSTGDNKSNFGIFLDSSPDRWGRTLMRRREAALARKADRKPKKFFETDYLLGLYDGHRMGALRFKKDIDGPFLDDNQEMATPPWASIRELEQASLHLESEDALNDPEYMKWINMLIAPGSSLGGARPKASIKDQDNHLWIAKFPSKQDRNDIGGWEMVTYELALAAGINMAPSMAHRYSSKYHTFLSKRFDRTADGNRIHFASAMTLLGFVDGQDGASYLDLAEFISSHGAEVETDLEQLWRRIVFNICVSNTDDHLRNHGFILTPIGWILSPAYDINPVETGTGLSLNISENDNSLDLEVAREVALYFRVDSVKANQIIGKVQSSVRNWKTVASRHNISRSEQELKAPAFFKAD